jgi:hypothetical protein
MKHTSILKIVSSLALLIALLPPTLVQTGCANIVPPSGGPRDSLPPRLVNMRPGDSTRNFTGKRIVAEFDEFVQIDNIQENLLVSPTPKIPPFVESKLRTVTITIKDTLEPNTTYSIDFGNALKDINEGNIYKNFTYLFSTGPALDSMRISGRVIIAESGKTDSTLIVMLHTSADDSAVIKDKPRYVARVQADGSFNFYNLPSDTFHLYALKDEGGQRRYLSKSQLFAFADAPVQTSVTPEPVTLYAYVEPEPDTSKPKTPAAGKTGPGRIRGGADKKNAEAENRLRVETNLASNELDLLSNLELRFSTPLKTFDSSKLRFTTEQFEPITNYRITRDTSNKVFTLVHAWTPNTAYNLILDSTFAEDTAGRKPTQIDTLAFRTKKTSEYGLVRLRIMNIDLGRNPVLQFVQSDQVKYSHPMNSREFNAPLFQPGEYDLRILYDENKNGIWDAGEFFGKHRQPEKVQPISRKLTVKANWDNIVDITLENGK